MSDRMDPATEQRMLNCVRQMAVSVRENAMDPTDALVKVAQVHHLTPPQVKRVGEAYNVSRSLANHKMASGEDRTKPFALAFPEKALNVIYPEHYKTASQAMIGREMLKVASIERAVGLPNMFEKAASAPLIEQGWAALATSEPVKYAPRPDAEFRQYQVKRDAHEKQARNLSTELAGVKLDFHRAMEKAADATLRALDKGLKFERLEQCLADRYGQDTGVKLASVMYVMVHGDERHLKRASTFHTTLQDYSLTPFNDIDRFVKAALDIETKGKALNRLQESAPQAIPFPVAATQTHSPYSSADELLFGKQADFLPTTRGVISGVMGKQDTGVEDAYNRELGKAMNRVADPTTRDAIRKVKVQSMLTDMLSNDPVLKSHPDREEILDYYNELSQLAPDVADQPMMVRGILRRAVQQGYLDPFEAGQFISNNSALKQNNKIDGENSLLKSMATDAQSLNPNLNIAGANPSAMQIINRGVINPSLLVRPTNRVATNTKFSDPALRLQADKLQQDNRQFAATHNLNRDKADADLAQFAKTHGLDLIKLKADIAARQAQSSLAEEQHLTGLQTGNADRQLQAAIATANLRKGTTNSDKTVGRQSSESNAAGDHIDNLSSTDKTWEGGDGGGSAGGAAGGTGNGRVSRADLKQDPNSVTLGSGSNMGVSSMSTDTSTRNMERTTGMTLPVDAVTKDIPAPITAAPIPYYGPGDPDRAPSYTAPEVPSE